MKTEQWDALTPEQKAASIEPAPHVKPRHDEQAELDQSSDRELIAYWNILQFRGRPGTILIDAEDKTGRHLRIVDKLLKRRGIAHRRGKLINR